MDRMRNSQTPHINYKFMDGLIPARQGYILPSDLDGILETNHHFLVFEWKRPGEEISKGQHILLSRLAQLPKFTVIVITGHSTSWDTEIKEFYQMNGRGELEERGFGVEEFKEKVRAWFLRSCGKTQREFIESSV